MTYEQKLKLERIKAIAKKKFNEIEEAEKAERYRRTKAKWEEKRFLKECGVEL